MSKFSRRSLQELCQHTKQACDALRPVVHEIYKSISAETAKTKADNSAFTIADGMVQHLLMNYLFAGKLKDIVGEEDSHVNITTKPYQVDDLTVPAAFEPLIDSAKDQVAAIAANICSHSYADLTAFIDPIDGTREFSIQLGEQCSICVGFSNAEGAPVAGVIYRPVTEPATWAAGAKSESYVDGVLDMAATPDLTGLITTNGSISPFSVEVMNECGLHRVCSGGVGNKVMMLLENKSGFYISDRGVSRWDTCAAQACLEARGGILFKLTSFLDSKALESYTYLKSTQNLDFIPGRAALTLYNVPDKSKVKKGETVLGTTVEQFQPYSNLCGLLAINENCMTSLDQIYDGLKRAEAKVAPSFD